MTCESGRPENEEKIYTYKQTKRYSLSHSLFFSQRIQIFKVLHLSLSLLLFLSLSI